MSTETKFNWAHWVQQKWLVVVLLVVFPPLGIFMLWQGNHYELKIRWIITVVSALWLFLHLLDAALAPVGGDDYGSCAATFYENGCTYYRDDDCNVIARSCD